MKKISSLIKKDNSVIFDGERMNIYIPSSYFDRNMANYNGKFINTLGIFLFEITTDNDFKSNKDGIFHKLKLPVKINFEYDDTYKIKKKIDKYAEDSYIVFVVKKGNIFLDNVYREQNANSTQDFINALHKGYLPKFIAYDEVIQMYLNNIQITKTNLRNCSMVFETIISECYRSKNNMKIPFRKIAGKTGNVNMYDYQNVNIKRLPSLNSTFADMAFEDVKQSIISSVNKTRSGAKENESPVEKTIKY